MYLSKKQVNMFWRLFAKAAAEVVPAGSREEVERYRHKVIHSATGKVSIKDINNDEFEAVMAALAIDAMDYKEAGYWGSADSRRFYKMTVECARQIGEITDRSLDEKYFEECFHMPFVTWEDIPVERIFSVFQMLDTYRRKLLKKAGWGGRDPDHPLSFYFDRIYIRGHYGRIDFYDPTTVADSR